jgi:tetratricopeptide (TPR) repeat protein
VKDLIEEAMKQAQLQNLNEALALLEKSLKIKETPFAFKLMGSIYYQLEDPRALSYLERAHAMDSKDLSTIRNLFVLYLLNKDFTNASAMLEKFKSLSHDTEQVDMLSRTLDEARKKVE